MERFVFLGNAMFPMRVVSESNAAMEAEWKRRSREIATTVARHRITPSDEPRRGEELGVRMAL